MHILLLCQNIPSGWRAADSVFVFQDLYGAAEPAIAGDNLDVTPSKLGNDVASIAMPSKASSANAKIEGLASSVSATGSTDSLSLGQKFFLIAVIVGVCALFVNTRKGGLKEKSMA